MRRIPATLSLLSLLSCCAADVGPAPPRPPIDAGTDAPVDAGIDAGQWAHVDPFFVEAPFGALRVREGSSADLLVLVGRRPGFEAPIEITAFGLPDGVEAEPVIARAGTGAVALRIAAAQGSATEAAQPFAITASAGGVRQNLRILVEVVR